MKGFLSIALIGALLTPAVAWAAVNSSTVAAQAIGSGTVSGTVVDGRKAPLGGATVTAVGGSTHVSATSSADGGFALTLPPGIYDITVRKGGFQEAEDTNVTVLSASSTPLRIVLIEATVSNLRLIGSVSSRSTASSSITPVASLSAQLLEQRQAPSLQEVLPEVPGVTFGSRGATTDPYQYFTVRGAAIETRVQIDGHPVTTGYTGKWDLSQVNPDVFGSVDVFKGPGIDGADAGESVFGTINLRTRDFSPSNVLEAGLGVDEYGAQFSSFLASGNLVGNRLSYLLNYNVNGIVGPEKGISGWDVWPDPNNPGKAVAVFPWLLDDDVNQRSELAKVRYRFSDATSLSAGFVGFQGTQNPQGLVYGYSVGPVTVEPSGVWGTDSSGNPIPIYNAPSAGYLVGQKIPGYVWYPGTFTTTNQPFFEGELRTALGNDTLLLRPYTGVLVRGVDGNAEANFPDGQFSPSYTTDASGKLVENFQSAYDEIENNRLHGVTFTYLHPFAAYGFLNFSYDYHSIFTSDIYGYPELTNVGAAPTTARTSDISLSTQLAIARNLKLALGDYQTIWNLDYLFGPNADQPATRTASHNDPHVGLNWRPSPNFAVRAAAGTGITVPYASQVSGFESVSNDNNTQTLQTVNPNLNPEVTTAYGLGTDVVLPSRLKLSLDLFHNTIHGAFVNSTYSVPPTVNPALSPLPYTVVAEWLNGPLERNYGLELTLTSPDRREGIGYVANATLQRAYYDQFAPSFYALAASSAINGQQIGGVPFATAHGELNWSRREGNFHFALGADYAGSNNWTNGPGFVTFYSTLGRDVGKLGRLQISAANLFNRSTGAPYGLPQYQGSGFAQPELGPNGSGTGLAYSAIPQYLNGIVPRTIRFSLTKRVGW